MNFEDINFPVYRRYKNKASYFKIVSPVLFEEVMLIGAKKLVKTTEANLFPEKMFVHDLVYNYQAMADEISEDDYIRIKTG